MKNLKSHINQEPERGNDFENMNKFLEVPYAKSKEEVWSELARKLEVTPKAKEINLFTNHAFRLAVAAVFALLIGIVGLMRFYTETIQSLPGEHQIVNLPDKSTIHMNAGSVVNYHPYWWQFNRSLTFTGEAYFQVQKGSKFKVTSEKGTVKVLGTQFTIFSRDEVYRVSCISGKVKVEDISQKHSVILEQDQKADLNNNGEFDIDKNINLSNATAWIDNKFIFTSVPLIDVLKEIERQYNVTISVQTEFDYKYTGNFNRNQDIDQVLDFVCRPFGIKYVKIKANEFQLGKTDN